MRYLQFITLTILVFAGFTFAQSDRRPADPEVEKAERDFFAALSNGDSKALDVLVADDVTDIDDSGQVGDKKRMLSNVRDFKAYNFVPINMVSRRIGNGAAVVVGWLSVAAKSDPKGKASYYIYSNTYAKAKNGWQLVATQQKEVPAWLARRMEDTELKALSATDCAQETALRSIDNAVPSYVRFKNAGTKPVTLYWLNFQGKRDTNPGQTQTIAAAAETQRFTWASHPFLITDDTGKCIGIYRPGNEAGIVVIK